MLKSQSKAIDGVEYTVTMLPFRRSNEALRRIGAILGPALADLGAALGDGGGKPGAKTSLLEMDVDLGKVGAALGAVFARLGQGEFDELALKNLLLTTTFKEDGKRLELCHEAVYDSHFAGGLDRCLKVLAFSAEVQYGNFFARVGQLARQASAGTAPQAESNSTSPTT